MGDNLAEGGQQWVDEFYDSPLVSTSIPDSAGKDANAVGTLVIIVVAALILIILLFGIAIFIDCRQQKLSNGTIAQRKFIKIKFPSFGRNVDEDRQTIVDNMNASSGASTSTTIEA